jgi:hypothetical protein
MESNKDIILIREKKEIYWDRNGKTTTDITILTDKYFHSIDKANEWIVNHCYADIRRRFPSDSEYDLFNRQKACTEMILKLSISDGDVTKSYTPITIPEYR